MQEESQFPYVVRDPPSKSDDYPPLHIALRITLLIVGPVPILMIFFAIAVPMELLTELVARDVWYYQTHRWCPCLACTLTGTIRFFVRRWPYLESGLLYVRLLVAMRISFLFDK